MTPANPAKVTELLEEAKVIAKKLKNCKALLAVEARVVEAAQERSEQIEEERGALSYRWRELSNELREALAEG